MISKLPEACKNRLDTLLEDQVWELQACPIGGRDLCFRKSIV